jgi:hypothetical protein
LFDDLMDLISMIGLQWFCVVKKLADTLLQFNFGVDIPLPVLEEDLYSLLSTRFCQFVEMCFVVARAIEMGILELE